MKYNVILCMGVCGMFGSPANEFIIEKPVAKKSKHVSCSQLKENIVQHAADIWQASADAVNDQAQILKKNSAKKCVQTCASVLESVAQLQHDTIAIISNMVNPEKGSCWDKLDREQLTRLCDGVKHCADQVVCDGCWCQAAQQVHDCMPKEQKKPAAQPKSGA